MFPLFVIIPCNFNFPLIVKLVPVLNVKVAAEPTVKVLVAGIYNASIDVLDETVPVKEVPFITQILVADEIMV